MTHNTLDVLAMLSLRLYGVLFLVVFADFAYAQNPLGQVGPWPSGSITLLGGLWFAMIALSGSRFDVLPPVILARAFHKISRLRQFLTLKGRHRGTLVQQIVLTSIDHSRSSICQEWDTLILRGSQSGDVESGSQPQSITESQGCTLMQHKMLSGSGSRESHTTEEKSYSFQVKTSQNPQSETFEFNIKTGKVDMLKLGPAFDVLLKCLDLGSPVQIDKLLEFWHALRMYQRYADKITWSKPGIDKSIRNADEQEAFLNCMGRMERVFDGEESSAGGGADEYNLHVPVFDSKYDSNEVPEGATMSFGHVKAKHIAAMLAFTKRMCGSCEVSINPVILCIWIWYDNKQRSRDSLLIQLPASERFLLPEPRASKTPSEPGRETDEQCEPCKADHTPEKKLPNLLDLSSSDWDIDGSHSMFFMSHLWFFCLWCLSLLIVALFAFFAIVSGGTSPNLAATLALMFVRPYARDSFLLTDAGYPPSWNGRRRIRWEEEKGKEWACSVFRGTFHRKMGPSGNSFARTIVAYVAAWVSWRYRLQLRSALQFGQPRPPPYWVIIIAILLEVVSVSFCFINLTRHVLKQYWKSTIAMVMLITYIAYDLYAMVFFKSAARWILLSEVGLLAAIPYAALIPRGVGPSYKPAVLYNLAIWCHIVASSCIYSVVSAP